MGERTRCYATRPRRIPPEFCSDELLERCSLLATLLLYRLISQADDQGRLPGSAKYVRAVCLAMRPNVSERNVEAALKELETHGFILRYDLKHREFLQIERWFDLQGKWGQRRTYASRYPAPPGWTGDWVNAGSGDDEVRAPGAQAADDVRPPTPFPVSSPSANPSAGPMKPPAVAGGSSSVGAMIDTATRGALSDEDAFRLGSALATPARPKRAAS